MQNKPPMLAGVCLLGLVGSAWSQAPAYSTGAPAYETVEVVSVSPTQRLLLVKDAAGIPETVELDDVVAGIGNVRSGDKVIVSLRSDPGRRRVTSLRKSTPSTTARAPAATAGREQPARPPADEMRARFAAQVARLADDADRVDEVFGQFVMQCDAKPTRRAQGRDWFSVWDGSVPADLSHGKCRELLNQVVANGDRVKQGMAAAEDAARESLDTTAIREILRMHSLDWEGWALPAPNPQEP